MNYANLSAKSGKMIILVLFTALLVSGCTIPIVKNSNAKKILTPDEARAAAGKFINENLLPANVQATINSATLEGDIYNINLDVSGQNYTSYLTKDGEKFFQNGIDIAKFIQDKAANPAANNQAQAVVQPPSDNIPKTDKPKVELFVMTYCPYGLQAEKGILPAFTALGDKIDSSVKFVHYFLHGDKEEQETYNQICIREEQTAKYNDYLNCFVGQGDSAQCVAQLGINQTKLSACVESKAKDYYKSDSALSQQYGVQGSPTLVINGVQSNAGRDAAGYLAGICSGFNNAPTECAKQLSNASPTAGFGEN